MADKSELNVGDLVKTVRCFDKATIVNGTIKAIPEEGDFVDVELENGTIESAHVGDVKVIQAAEQAADKSKSKSKSNGGSKEKPAAKDAEKDKAKGASD